MESLVKLIEVNGTKNTEARDSLYNNCTHVENNYWLFEGEMFNVDTSVDQE